MALNNLRGQAVFTMTLVIVLVPLSMNHCFNWLKTVPLYPSNKNNNKNGKNLGHFRSFD